MRIVKYYSDALHANIDREKLEAAGITAVVFNEHTGIVIPLTQSIPSLRPHVVVADEDYDAAMEELGLPKTELPRETVCPRCGSKSVKFGFRGGSRLRRFLARFIFFPIAAFTGSPIGNIYGNYRCRKCGCEFEE